MRLSKNKYIIYIIISIALYVFAPKNFNMVFCVCCAILYILVAVENLVYDARNGSILSFTTLFSLFLFITSFLIPLFLYSVGGYFFYDRYICKGSTFPTLALCLYSYGKILAQDKVSSQNNESRQIKLTESTIKALNLFSVIVVIFYVLKFRSFLTVSASDINDVGDRYLVTLLSSILPLTLLICTIYHQESIKSFKSFLLQNKIAIVGYIVAIVSSLYIGDRTIPIYMILSAVYIYSTYVRKIKFAVLISGVAFLGLLLFFVGQTRKSDSSIRSSGINAFIEASRSVSTETESFIDYFSDFLPASEANYLFIRWREQNDGALYYPGRIFINLLNPIPYVPSILSETIYGLPYSTLSSGTLSTSLYSFNIRTIEGGIGTHAVGDIYVSWGILGIIVLFIFLGYLIEITRLTNSKNIYSSIIYMAFFSDAIYMARASIFDCYRTFVFQIVLLWLISSLNSSSNK